MSIFKPPAGYRLVPAMFTRTQGTHDTKAGSATVNASTIHDIFPGVEALEGYFICSEDPNNWVWVDEFAWSKDKDDFYAPGAMKKHTWIYNTKNDPEKPFNPRKGSRATYSFYGRPVVSTRPWHNTTKLPERFTCLVSLDLPVGADQEDARAYILNWVTSGKGGEHPDHPMSRLDAKSVKVTVR